MKNKLMVTVIFLLMVNSVAFSQILKPVKWKVYLSEKTVKVGDEVDIVFKATIDKSWHLYSNDFDENLGPMLISFDFEADASYQRVGDVKPINAKKHYDKLWKGDVSYFENKGELRQKIKIVKLPLHIEGTFDFQSCSEKSGQCVMGDDEFTIDYPKKKK